MKTEKNYGLIYSCEGRGFHRVGGCGLAGVVVPWVGAAWGHESLGQVPSWASATWEKVSGGHGEWTPPSSLQCGKENWEGMPWAENRGDRGLGMCHLGEVPGADVVVLQCGEERRQSAMSRDERSSSPGQVPSWGTSPRRALL